MSEKEVIETLGDDDSGGVDDCWTNEEEADDKLKMRYLKLKRRMVIKDHNRGSAK